MGIWWTIIALTLFASVAAAGFALALASMRRLNGRNGDVGASVMLVIAVVLISMGALPIFFVALVAAGPNFS